MSRNIIDDMVLTFRCQQGILWHLNQGARMSEKTGQTVTLSDVARKAGISRTTAAKVLLGTGGDHVRVGDAAQARVRQAAEALSYRPNRAAQRLAGARTQTLGVLMDTVNAPVMNDRLAAIEREAARRGYRLLIGQVHGRLSVLADYLADFDSRGVDAFLCLFDVTRGRAGRLRPLLGGRRDVVMHGKPLQAGGYCVRVDTAGAVMRLVEHLLARGRRRIGLQLENMADELMPLRRKAYEAALKAHAQPVRPALIWAARSESVMPSPETIDDAIAHLVRDGRADAIVASNDIWAARLIQGLRAQGRAVPGTVAVTGYDNLDLATIVEPPLTTIDQQHDAYAIGALDLLTAIASGTLPPASKRTIVISPSLIVRSSTQEGPAS
jgi:DNA-binding LacI/PurR family transcriptional regulator